VAWIYVLGAVAVLMLLLAAVLVALAGPSPEDRRPSS
jgi:hypothetical protein